MLFYRTNKIIFRSTDSGIKVSAIFETASVRIFIPPILIRQKYLGALKKYGLDWWGNMGRVGAQKGEIFWSGSINRKNFGSAEIPWLTEKHGLDWGKMWVGSGVKYGSCQWKKSFFSQPSLGPKGENFFGLVL